MISCQQIVESRWFDAKCEELAGRPATRDSDIKAFNWFHLVPNWVSSEDLFTKQHPWANPLPSISWTAGAVMGESEQELAETRAREATPLPDSPKGSDVDAAWLIDEDDYC